MRSAPSVDFTVGPSRLQAALAASGWLAGLATLVGWMLKVPPGVPHALAALLLAACGLVALSGSRRGATGALSWDGTGWTWALSGAGRGRAVRVELACDLQRVLLVRLVPLDRRPRDAGWLWLQRGSDPPLWRALRRAVYFSGGLEVPPQRPAATPSA